MKKTVKLICVGVIAAAVCAVIISCATSGRGGKISEIVVQNDGDGIVFAEIIPIKKNGSYDRNKRQRTAGIDPKGEEIIIVPNGKYSIQVGPLGPQVHLIRDLIGERITEDLQNTRIVISFISRSQLQVVSRDTIDISLRERLAAQDSGEIYEELAKEAFAEIDTALASNIKPNAAIAVFPIAVSNKRNAGDGELVLEQLSIDLVNSGKYTVIEKRLVDELLAEYDFQMSGLVSEGSKTMGELLGADAVIFGSLNNNPGTNRNLNVWAVDTSRRTTLAKSELRNNPRDANVTLLPISGGSNSEEKTIVDFIVNHWQRGGIADASGEAELAQYTGNLASFPRARIAELRNTLIRLGYNPNVVISAYIQRIGERNMLVVNTYSMAGHGSSYDIKYLEYSDALELWVKMPAITRSIGISGSSSITAMELHIWANYGAGVNRSESESLLQFLATDIMAVAGSVGAAREIKSFRDATPEIEAVMAAISPAQRTQLSQARTRRRPEDFSVWDATNLLTDTHKSLYPDETRPIEIVCFDITRVGNRTRIEAYRYAQSGVRRISMEYSSRQEFLRKMRIFSQQMIRLVSSGATEWSVVFWDGYNSAAPVADAPIPANFTHIKRAGATPGVVPMGGFYISNEVTQRDFERIMRRNPSAVRNPNQPVTNVPIIDAIMYCNALSLQAGLEPAYLVTLFPDGASWLNTRSETYQVAIFRDANGYRLPFNDELKYAFDNIDMSNAGLSHIYVFEGVGQYIGIRSDTFGGIPWSLHSRGASFSMSRNGDISGVGMHDTAASIASRATLGIRVVRPVFDYWKYSAE